MPVEQTLTVELRAGPGIRHTYELPDERVTVGVRSRGVESDDGVTGAYLAAVDDRLLLDHADAESCEVVIAAVIHAGHFGGFTADQRGARLNAALDDAAHHRLGDTDLELAGGVVVEEEQRFGALYHHVVGAHGDQVDADGVVTAGVDRQPQLGADSVGARHQHRVAVTR